jgi:hypothetical protein
LPSAQGGTQDKQKEGTKATAKLSLLWALIGHWGRAHAALAEDSENVALVADILIWETSTFK